MNSHRRWRVEILINEHDHKTQAHARLDTHNDLHAHGQGSAPRSPVDTTPSEVRDQVAAAMALSDLADKMAARVGCRLETGWLAPETQRRRRG